jgi:hypothetical protein
MTPCALALTLRQASISRPNTTHMKTLLFDISLSSDSAAKFFTGAEGAGGAASFVARRLIERPEKLFLARRAALAAFDYRRGPEGWRLTS